MPSPTDPREIVKSGYDQAAAGYGAARPREPEAQRLLSRLLAGLSPGARVLDAGCGAGVPVARALATEHEVLGIDLSPVQVTLARTNVPEATFEVGDISALELPDSAFDGIVCYYAIIHVPRADHRHVLAGFQRVLKPDGLLLVCMGNRDLPGAIEDDFFGARMYWSHFDRATNVGMIGGAGFEIIGAQEVPDALGDSSHLFVLARRA